MLKLIKTKKKNKMSKVQNKEATIETKDLIELVKNQIVSDATQKIFNEITNLENLRNLSDNIAVELTEDLMHGSFMSEQLELTEEQKERLTPAITSLVEKAKNNYLAKIKKSERTKDIALIIKDNLTAILDEMLSNLASEVNRGALINCIAVAADTKNKDYNKIELNALKSAGDITIPTRCLLVSTNCLDIIKFSIDEEIKIENKE